MSKLTLDYVVAAETAFFSDDARVSVIRIFRNITILENKTEYKEITLGFSVTGRVFGPYGNGVNLQIVNKDDKEVVPTVFAKTTDLKKDFLNFVVNVQSAKFAKGEYFAVITDEKGGFVGKEFIFKVD